MKEKVMQGKPYEGSSHVRFDEGKVALAATPRRGSLLCKTLTGIPALLAAAALSPLHADPPPSTTAGAYAEHLLALIETRPGDCDTGLATIDTAKPVGFTLVIR